MGNGIMLAVDGVTDTSAVVTAIVNAAKTVATDGMNAITQILPVVAPVMAALIVVGIGIKAIKKFTGR